MINSSSKILIIRLSSLGDVILSTVLPKFLNFHYPGIKIDFLVLDKFADVYKDNPFIKTVFAVSKQNLATLKKLLQSEGYDLVIDLQNNIRTRKLLYGINSLVVKFNKYHFRKFLLVKFKIDLLKNLPQIPLRYIDSLSSVLPGYKEMRKDFQTELFLNDDFDLNLPLGAKIICIAPGAAHFTKRWGESNFSNLIQILVENGFTPVLIGGLSEKNLCAQISQNTGDVFDLSGEDNLSKVVSLFKKSLLLVCNDSGLMHAACAVQLPVVSIFGSSVEQFGFAPYSTNSIILQNNSLSCRPCSHIGRSACPKKHFNCMRSISPEEVFIKVQLLLKDVK
ncbi:MAG: glycosyltransferase family 9 protein [Ignavibacteriaceae bacterium]|nr:glycosyltransferase family 9 protein [Ignavibacteriaceae bacterium]